MKRKCVFILSILILVVATVFCGCISSEPNSQENEKHNATTKSYEELTQEEQLAPFNYELTPVSCIITGLKDKTATEIIIPSCVTTISKTAFMDCYYIDKVTWFAVKCMSAGDVLSSCFQNCCMLKTVVIGENVEELPYYLFENCESITTVYWNAINCNRSSLQSYYSPFSGCSKLSTVIVGNSVKTIPCGAFHGCTSMNNLTIGKSVETIEHQAFHACSGLTNIIIPNNVKNIESYAFADCKGVASVKIGIGVTKIGSYAFGYCNQLANVVFENPNGWKTDGKVLENLNDTSTAALYLTTSYKTKDWIRGE